MNEINRSDRMPLVLVHGYLGGSEQWEDQVRVFQERYDVVTPDLPGFGLQHEMKSPDTIAGYANYVLDYVEQQGISNFHLLGHSMGGMIVQQMVAQQPSRIAKLILYGTGPLGSMPGRFETLARSRQRLLSDGIEATARRIAATWFLHGETGNGYVPCAEIGVKASMQAALAALTAMETWSGEPELTNVKSKTLVLWGDHDRAYLWPQPNQLWCSIKDAELAVVPGCSHAVHLEKPELFNAILLDFLNSN